MSETEVQPQETANTAVETPPPPPETATAPIETLKAAIETVAPKKEKPLSDWAKRYVITKNLPGKRGEMVKAVIEEGIKQGYWESVSHFMDKAIDFAINSQAANKALGITKGFQFGIPDNVPTAIFENGYYWQFDKLKTHESI